MKDKELIVSGINMSRGEVANLIKDMKELQKALTPPAVQEVVLAQRALEDARMRLGIAGAYVEGQDPLAGK